MIKLVMSLGSFSNSIQSLFLPGIKIPNIIIIPNENSIILWSLKIGSTIAILKKSCKILSKIVNLEAIKYNKFRHVWLAGGFECGIIQIWKLDINKSSIECRIFKGHEKSLSSLLFNTSKFLLASSCKEGTIVLWNIFKKVGIFRIKFAHLGKINSLCFVESSKTLTKHIVTCGADNLIKFWDLNFGNCCKILSLPLFAIFCVNFFPGRNLLIFSTENNKISVYFKKKFLKFYFVGQILKSKNSNYSKFKIDPTKTFLFIYGKDKFIEIFSFKKKKKKISKIFRDKKNQITISDIFSNSFFFIFFSKILGIDFCVQKNKQNLILYVQYVSFHFELFKIAKTFDLKKNCCISLFKIYHSKIELIQSDVREILWFSKDYLIVSLCGFAKTINVWYLSTQKCRFTIFLRSSGLCMALCGLKNVAIGNKKGNLEIIDIFSGNLIFSKNKAHFGPIWTIDMIKNFFCLVTGGSDGCLKIWEFDLSGVFLSKYLKLSDQILEIKLVLGKNFLIVSTLSSKLDIFLLDNLQFNFSLYGHILPVMSLSVCDNDSYLASGSADSSFRIWDLKTRQIKKIINSLDSMVTSIVFQKYKRNIFTGFRNGKIFLWSHNTYFLLYSLENFHQGPVWVLRSSNNGNFLASGSQDKSLKIWKIQKNIPTLTQRNRTFLEKKNDNKSHEIFFSNEKPQKRKPIKFLNCFYEFFGEKNKNLTYEKKNEKIRKKKILKFFFNMTKNDWVYIVKNKKYEDFIYLIGFILLENQGNLQEDMISFIDQIILKMILPLRRRKKFCDAHLELIKICKKILNSFEKKFFFNLKSLEFLKKTSSI